MDTPQGPSTGKMQRKMKQKNAKKQGLPLAHNQWINHAFEGKRRRKQMVLLHPVHSARPLGHSLTRSFTHPFRRRHSTTCPPGQLIRVDELGVDLNPTLAHGGAVHSRVFATGSLHDLGEKVRHRERKRAVAVTE